MISTHPTLHGTQANLADLIAGDIVADHNSHRLVGTVDTVGGSLVNVVARGGVHRAYRAEQIDRVA